MDHQPLRPSKKVWAQSFR